MFALQLNMTKKKIISWVIKCFYFLLDCDWYPVPYIYNSSYTWRGFNFVTSSVLQLLTEFFLGLSNTVICLNILSVKGYSRP